MDGLDFGLARRAEDGEAGGRAGMCLRCWKPAHTLISMEEVHSTETGEKENRKRPLTLPAVLEAEIQAMESWSLETRQGRLRCS